MMPLHRWPHWVSLKSKRLPRYGDRRFQMSCKAFFCGKSPSIALRLGKCLIKVRIHRLLYLNLALFYELCDFPQIVRSDAIWGHLCEIAPSRHIRWPVHFKVDNIIWNQPQNVNKPVHSGCSQISLVNSNMKFVKVKNLF